jgi:hypothetical protein
MEAEEAAAAAAAIDAAEKGTIRNYEQHIKDTKTMLQDSFIQNLLIYILHTFQRRLYKDPRIKDILRTGLSHALQAHFTNEMAMKTHLFRFFVKGGSAPIFLYDLKNEKGQFAFSSDIDTIILINPELLNEDYATLHANIIKCCIIIINEILQNPYRPTAIQIRNLFGPSSMNKPSITKYVDIFIGNPEGAADGGILPRTPEEGKMPAVVESIADISDFDYPYITNKDAREAALTQQLADYAQRANDLAAEGLTVQETLREESIKMANANQELVHLAQIDAEVRAKQLYAIQYGQHPIIITQEAIQRHQQGVHEHSQRLQAATQEYTRAQQRSLAIPLESFMLAGQLLVAQQELDHLQAEKHRLENEFRRYLLTYNVKLNHSYELVPPQNGRQYKYLNETLIAIRPNSSEHFTMELIDIVIPFKTNQFLREDWKLSSIITKEVDGKYFDIADPVFTLFDQRRATNAIRNVPRLADKFASRSRRSRYIKSQIAQAVKRNNVTIKRSLNHMKAQIPAENFKRIYLDAEGGRRTMRQQRLQHKN